MNDEDITIFEDDSSVVILSSEVVEEPISSELLDDEDISEQGSEEENSEASSELPVQNYEGTITYQLDESVVSDIQNIKVSCGLLFVIAGTAFFIWLISLVVKELNRVL